MKHKNRLVEIVITSVLLTLFMGSLGFALRLNNPVLSEEMDISKRFLAIKTIFILISIIFLLNYGYRSKNKSLKFIFLRNAIVSVLFASTLLASLYLFDLGNFHFQKKSFLIGFNYVFLLLMTQLIIAYIRSYQMKLETERNLAKIEQEKLSIELNALKGQLNPHFLFNALNTLNGLIRLDPEKALRFNEQMSTLFRYILQNKDVLLVDLALEIEFLHHYLDLYQSRYGDNLRYTIDVAEKYSSLKIPSLSLQLLAENAIKHNEISTQHPLNIIVSCDGEFLVMKNNINPKYKQAESTGIGLANLNKRYQLLLEQDIRISKKNDHFIVSLPLNNSINRKP